MSGEISEEQVKEKDVLAQEQRRLPDLFRQHMRARIMLRDLLRVEQRLLSDIVARLERVPELLREEIVQECVARASAELVDESRGK